MFRLTVNIGGAFDLYVSPAASDELRNAAPEPHFSNLVSDKDSVNVDLLRYEESADYGRSRRLLLLTEPQVDAEWLEGLRAKLELEVGMDFDNVMRARNKDEVNDETGRIYRACKSLDSWVDSPGDKRKGTAEPQVTHDAIHSKNEFARWSRRSEQAAKESYPDIAPSSGSQRYILVCLVAILVLSATSVGLHYMHYTRGAHPTNGTQLLPLDKVRGDIAALSKRLNATGNEMVDRFSALDEDVAKLKGEIADLAARPIVEPTKQKPDTPTKKPIRASEQERIGIQRGLQKLQHYQGPLDGDFGVGTRKAIEAYQRYEGRPATGFLTVHQAIKLLQVGTHREMVR